MTFDEWYEDKSRQTIEKKDLVRAAYYKGRGDQAAEDQAEYAAYRKGVRESNARNLPGVTKMQVLRFYNTLIDEVQSDRFALAYALSQWFNDPNRDAPVEPTMHPDLEWLASVPPERYNIPRIYQKQGRGEPFFYRRTDAGGLSGVSAVGCGTDPLKAPQGVETFTLTEIDQARKHLARQDIFDRQETHVAKRVRELEAECREAKAERRSIKEERLRQLEAERDAHLAEDAGIDMTHATVKDQEETIAFGYKPTARYDCGHESTVLDHQIPFLCPECGNGVFDNAYGLTPQTEYCISFTGVDGEGLPTSDTFTTEYLAQKAEEFKQKDPYAVDARDRMMHDLINLPDYETWFEAHGHESTTGNIIVPATVNELYTHFRARLLDELHQAGVIGGD